MKVLVTGADGLLGSNLVRVLLHGGHDVRALVHPASKSTTLNNLPIEKTLGDILEPARVKAAVKDCGAVFHCAASTAMWPPRNPRVTAINVEGTRHVLAAMAHNNGSRLVHVGSASSFGYGTMENPGAEQTPYRYQSAGLDYFDSKLQAQKLVLEYAAAGWVDAVVVNPTFMFGPHDAAPSSGRMLVQFTRMNLPFYPPGGRNFVHVRDVAQGMIGALEKGKTGECYLLGHHNMTMKELFGVMARVTGSRPPQIKIPPDLMRLAGRVGSGVAALSGKAPALSYEMAMGSCTGSYYNPAKAVRELSLAQTPIETAIEEAYRWLKDNGYL